jgi:hypothetical protein
MYNLDVSTREKPVMNVDDIYLILYYHWVVDTAIFPDGRQRVQIALLVLEMAYTATRPAALVYVRRNEKRYLIPPIWRICYSAGPLLEAGSPSGTRSWARSVSVPIALLRSSSRRSGSIFIAFEVTTFGYKRGRSVVSAQFH